MRPALLLLAVWGAGFFSWKYSPFPDSPSSPQHWILPGPLTIQEKILLGERFSPNELGLQDWEALPEIGPSLARRIVGYREANGPFSSSQVLLKVPGVGLKTLEKLKPFLKE